MDGIQTPDGLKFIVTTNHPGRLDPAIVRPGRIDDVIEVGPLSLASARHMFAAFYGRDGIDSYTPRTGAELQQMFSTLSPEAAEAALAQAALAPPRRTVPPTRRANGFDGIAASADGGEAINLPQATRPARQPVVAVRAYTSMMRDK